MPARMAEMIHYVKERNFEGFGQLTMKDSNQFHATCLDTFPPISYLNDTSRHIIHLVHRFNAHHGQTKARWAGAVPEIQSAPQATSVSKTSACLSVTELYRLCFMLLRAEHRQFLSVALWFHDCGISPCTSKHWCGDLPTPTRSCVIGQRYHSSTLG